VSCGGQSERLIEEDGFELIRAEPRLAEEDLASLRIVLSGEAFNTVDQFSAKALAPRVENEVRLFGEIKPAVVLAGWCLSVAVSARAARIPFVNARFILDAEVDSLCHSNYPGSVLCVSATKLTNQGDHNNE